jgi:hypothetical protein
MAQIYLTHNILQQGDLWISVLLTFVEDAKRKGPTTVPAHYSKILEANMKVMKSMLLETEKMIGVCGKVSQILKIAFNEKQHLVIYFFVYWTRNCGRGRMSTLTN